MLLSRHELSRIYALFWSDFDADFYADIEDFVQILCRFLHKKMLVGSSGHRFDIIIIDHWLIIDHFAQMVDILHFVVNVVSKWPIFHQNLSKWR